MHWSSAPHLWYICCRPRSDIILTNDSDYESNVCHPQERLSSNGQKHSSERQRFLCVALNFELSAATDMCTINSQSLILTIDKSTLFREALIMTPAAMWFYLSFHLFLSDYSILQCMAVLLFCRVGGF